jgi:hypothetical protein
MKGRPLPCRALCVSVNCLLSTVMKVAHARVTLENHRG